MPQPNLTTLFNIPAVRDYVSTFQALKMSGGSDAQSVMDRAIQSLYEIYNEGPVASFSEYAEKVEAKRFAIEADARIDAEEADWYAEAAKLEELYGVCDPVAASLKAQKQIARNLEEDLDLVYCQCDEDEIFDRCGRSESEKILWNLDVKDLENKITESNKETHRIQEELEGLCKDMGISVEDYYRDRRYSYSDSD
jgi:hypothetical protein